MHLHKLELRCMGEDEKVVTEELTIDDARFCQIYHKGTYKGLKILSMTWTHKGETNKLIFGD